MIQPKTIALCALMLLPVAAAAGPDHAHGHDHAHDHGGLVASGEVREFYVPVPPAVRQRMDEKTTNIVVNFNPSSCLSNNATVSPWPTDAREAFEFAAGVWSAILNGSETIEVDACWRTDMAANTLGSAGPRDWYQNFTNAPRSDTWYPVALANELSGSDQNGSNAEIRANFNSNFTWHFEPDGQATSSEYDFITVVIHEIGHGLGFTGSMIVDDGTGNDECNGTAGDGCFGAGTSDPFIYDRFTENLNGTALISYSSPSSALGTQLTSNDVFFDGTSANILNGGNRVPLYAPSTWNFGSSYSHLDEDFNGTDDALMTFSLDFAETVHYPGRVTIGMFIDMGWDIRNLSTVWVDASYTGQEIGGPTNPFDTVGEGVKAVEPGGTVIIRQGNYAEPLTVLRAMILDGENGSAVVGQ